MKTNRPTSIPRVQTLFQAFAPLIALATAPTLRTAKAGWLALLALTAALIVAPGLIAQGVTTAGIGGFVTDKAN
ncbi:MAG: hypothetical protein CK538_07935, partial [Opitutia bacterium]